MIPRETIERIVAAARIEDVVSDYVTLRKRGANLIGLCPFHEEKTGSFTVSPAKGIFKCFGCGKAGNAVNFVMGMEQCTYIDALRMLAKKYHIEIQEREMTDEEREAQTEREGLFNLNEWANEWFQKCLWETEEGRNIGLKYFMERGLREDIIRKFHLGYAPEKNALYDEAHKAGFPDKYIEATGLCGKSQYDKYYDRFRGRVIFPIYTVSGKTVAFAGRILKKQEHVGKYVNSPDSVIYSKQNELYGLSVARQAIAKAGVCYLVEGQMDVISMHQAGIENVVSSGGTSLTRHQILLLHRFAENVTVLYDGDAAGIHAALRGIDMLLEEGINVRVVLLPDGEDPDSFAQKQNASDFIQFIENHQQNFIHFKTNLLMQGTKPDTDEKSAAINDIVTSISVIPDSIKRASYAKDCSELTGISEKTLLNVIEEKRNEKEKELKKRKWQQQEQRSNGQSSTTQSVSSSTSGDKTGETTTKPITDIQQMVTLSASEQSEKKYDKNIRNLLQLLIRHGEKTLMTTEAGEPVTVAQYVLEDLDSDEIRFDNPVYNKVIDDLRVHLGDEGFKAETYFCNHPDPKISSLASDLISEQYTLSKIYGKKSISENVKVEVAMPKEADELAELTPRLIYELKLAIIKRQIDTLREMLRHAQENHEDETMLQLLQQLPLLEQVKQMLCKALGQRIR